MVELEFLGLKYLHLRPVTEDYTCELLDATLVGRTAISTGATAVCRRRS